MKQPITLRAALGAPESAIPPQLAQGTVQGVDVVSREIVVLLPGGMAVFDVPPDCPILLHGERIKLRMVQLHDQVRIAYFCCQGLLVASQLEVQPDSGLACFRL